ncbi:MAG: replication-relaxation family protein [Betaproteobacteria bacterium]|jgi:hypothetical protein|nr:replication-relaxation family protein [Betaproteobacteria bacterium]OZB42391.1 MAG: hypothetical protein B7X46_14240 [Thiomonas sp. 15-66-11]
MSALPPQMSFAQRMQRVEQKQNIVLRFLRDEIYTTQKVLEMLLGLSPDRTKKTLINMQKAELITRKQVVAGNGWAPVLWGITPHGQGMACIQSETDFPNERYFQPGRVGLSMLHHTIGLQKIRIQAERAGWTGWINGDKAAEFDAESRPDAVVTDTGGRRWCIEYERTMKVKTRYQGILFARLRAIKNGAYERVCWVCDTPQASLLLRNAILSLRKFEVKQAGVKQQIVIDPEKHHPLLSFVDLSHFPPG